MPDAIFQIIKAKALAHLHWCHCPFLKKQGNLHQKFQLAKSKKSKEREAAKIRLQRVFMQ
jgi:hypothetical protein